MSDEAAGHSGRCLWGAIGYRVEGAPRWIANCHCASCRRAVGAPLTTYAGFPAERFAWTAGEPQRFAWTAGEPQRFASSAGVTRTFCGRCGSSLTYQGERWPDEIHVLVATLERPEDFPPARDAFVEEKLPWLDLGGS